MFVPECRRELLDGAPENLTRSLHLLVRSAWEVRVLLSVPKREVAWSRPLFLGQTNGR